MVGAWVGVGVGAVRAVEWVLRRDGAVGVARRVMLLAAGQGGYLLGWVRAGAVVSC